MAVDDEHADSASARDRLLAIYRGWKRALVDRTIPLWLKQPSARTAMGGLLIFTCVVLLPLDTAIWTPNPFFSLPSGWLPRSGWPIAIGLLGSYLVNVLVVSRWLSRNIASPGIYRPWLRVSLLLLGGFPIVGKLVLPGWRLIREAAHPWTLRGRPRTPALSLKQHSPLVLLRRLEQPLIDRITSGTSLVLLLLAEILVLFWISLWLAHEANEGRLAHQDLFILSLIFHALLFSLLFFLGLRAGRLGRTLPPWQHLALVGATFLCLLPVPWVSFAGILSLMTLEPGMARPGALLWQAFARRQETGHLPLWLELEDSLRQGWSRLPWLQRVRSPPKSVTRQPDMGKIETRVLLLYDLETFALGFDAACLGWALSWLAGCLPSGAPAIRIFTSALLYGSLFLGGCALCIHAAHFAQGLLRLSGPLRVLDRHPYAVYLLKTQLALAAGLLCGREIGRSDPRQIGHLVLYLCILLSIQKGLGLIVRPLLPRARWQRQARGEILIVLLLWTVAILAGLGGQLDGLLEILALWLLSWPLRLLCGHWYLPWLLKPYSWRDALDPAFPRHLRRSLAVLTLSAVFPLGGLAVPACIYIRDRRWPEAEALWLQRLPHFSGQRRNF
jgi:hypothetical protein